MKLFIFPFFLIYGFLASASTCKAGVDLLSTCSCQVSELHPTQFAVGLRAVKEKEKKLSQLQNLNDLDKYLYKNPEPIVLGPDHQIFILDHHHLARALSELQIPQTYCQLQKDFSSLSETEFWAEMDRNGWLYLYDENGKGPLPASTLPKNVNDMRDDPYRSLAKAVRDAGGYDETTELYADFKWANFFRVRIQIGSTDADFQSATKEALILAESADANQLPGYHGRAHSESIRCVEAN